MDKIDSFSSKDFQDFANIIFISKNSPKLTTDDTEGTFFTDGNKFYIKFNATRKTPSDVEPAVCSYYVQYDSKESIIREINPPIQKVDDATLTSKITEEDNCSTDTLFQWAKDTYNNQSDIALITETNEARYKLFNGDINFYYDEDICKKIHPFVQEQEGSIVWTEDLSNITTTVAKDDTIVPFCTNDSQLNVIEGKFDSLRYGQQMFMGCTALHSVEENKFPALVNGNEMFSGCTNFGPSIIKCFPSLKTAQNMFKNCESLLTADIVSENICDLQSAFEGCERINSINLGAYKPSSYKNAFRNTPNLASLGLGKTDIQHINNLNQEDMNSVAYFQFKLENENINDDTAKKLLTTFPNILDVSIIAKHDTLQECSLECKKCSIINSQDKYTIIFSNVSLPDVPVGRTGEDENEDKDKFVWQLNFANTGTLNNALKEAKITTIEQFCVENLSSADGAFSSSLLSPESVKNIYDNLPTYTQGEHVITLGIDSTIMEFYCKKTPEYEYEYNYNDYCGEFKCAKKTPDGSLIVERKNQLNTYNIHQKENEPIQTMFGFFVNIEEEKNRNKQTENDEQTENRVDSPPISLVSEKFDNYRVATSYKKEITIEGETTQYDFYQNPFFFPTKENHCGNTFVEFSCDASKKDNVFLQITDVNEHACNSESTDDLMNYIITDGEPKVGDNVVFAGRWSDLFTYDENGSLNINLELSCKTFYHYYIEYKCNTPVIPTPINVDDSTDPDVQQQSDDETTHITNEPIVSKDSEGVLTVGGFTLPTFNPSSPLSCYGHLYISDLTEEGIFILKDDKFNTKGWTLDLRFNKNDENYSDVTLESKSEEDTLDDIEEAS